MLYWAKTHIFSSSVLINNQSKSKHFILVEAMNENFFRLFTTLLLHKIQTKGIQVILKYHIDSYSLLALEKGQTRGSSYVFHSKEAQK